MRIYFEDGRVEFGRAPIRTDVIIDAAEGLTANRIDLDYHARLPGDITIYTNSLIALDNHYCWNHERNECDLFLWNEDKHHWEPAICRTDKEIRFAHNIRKMYLAGTFDLEEETNGW